MAYLTLVAAVPPEQIKAIRDDEKVILIPTMVKGVSHLLAYWIKAQPLGELLARVIDGGERLNESFWHPLRPPMIHEPAAVVSLAADLTLEWETLRAATAIHDEWLDSEMNRLLAVMNHACDNMNAIVTALDFPGDDERARRVRIPWLPYSKLHGATRRRWWPPWR